jgi:hypothetical protein
MEKKRIVKMKRASVSYGTISNNVIHMKMVSQKGREQINT